MIKHFTDNDLDNAEYNVMHDPKYGAENRLITECFKLHPYNKDINIIAMKICLIDVTNSTNLSRYKSKISVADLADIIFNIKDFDERVKQGDLELVNDIARIAKVTYGVNLFSFASKYCCYHNCNYYGRDNYSIYDGVLQKYLPNYDDSIKSNKIKKWKDRFDYKAYCDCIENILNSNSVTVNNKRRKFDHYVWWNNRKPSSSNNNKQNVANTSNQSNNNKQNVANTPNQSKTKNPLSNKTVKGTTIGD